MKYQKDWEQRSVGGAFSPEAGEKPVRGERDSEEHRGEWAEGPSRAQQLEKPAAMEGAVSPSCLSKAPLFQPRSPLAARSPVFGWEWPIFRTWTEILCWLIAAWREPMLA